MNRYRPAMAALLSAGALSMVPLTSAASTAWAEPGVPGPDENVAGTGTPSAAGVFTPEPDSSQAVRDACKVFTYALSAAAQDYDEFAYAAAGGGNFIDYGKPEVERANVRGRATLREASNLVQEASGIPGLPPDIADPMREWSGDAMKVVLVMAVRGGGDWLDSTVNELNNAAERANKACAMTMLHGGRAPAAPPQAPPPVPGPAPVPPAPGPIPAPIP